MYQQRTLFVLISLHDVKADLHTMKTPLILVPITMALVLVGPVVDGKRSLSEGAGSGRSREARATRA